MTNALYKMNVQKLNEVLRNFEIIKQEFPSKTKKKIISLYLYYFGPGYKFERNGPKISFWRSNWILKFLYRFFLQTPKSLDYMQFYMTLLDLRNLLQKKDLGVVMLHLVSPVHAFLVT